MKPFEQFHVCLPCMNGRRRKKKWIKSSRRGSVYATRGFTTLRNKPIWLSKISIEMELRMYSLVKKFCSHSKTFSTWGQIAQKITKKKLKVLETREGFLTYLLTMETSFIIDLMEILWLHITEFIMESVKDLCKFRSKITSISVCCTS